MKHILPLLLLCVSSMSIAQIPASQKPKLIAPAEGSDPSTILWYDSMKEPFELIGFEWVKQDSIFRRLPSNPQWKIPEAVDRLANQTAGGQLRFQTNSKRIVLKVELSERSGMYHMPATGQSGFDLYIEKNGLKRYMKTARFSHDSLQYQTIFEVGKENSMRQFSLNFPLYNGVKSLFIGVEKNSIIRNPKPFTLPGKIVIYGTSITQGGCVSRPGMVYSNILSQKLDTEFINLGFSGNGKGEPELAHIINQISGISLIILDYEANANKTIQKTINKFVDILRDKHPITPILIMSKTRYASDAIGSDSFNLLMNNRDFQKRLVADKKNKGDDNIYFIDGSLVLGEDYYECTVDGVHPSDLGSYRIAQGMIGKIREILKDKIEISKKHHKK